MDTFKIVIKGQEYETQASSEEEATKKILDHLKKNKPAAVKNKKNDTKAEEIVDTNVGKRVIVDYKIFTDDSSYSLQMSVKGQISQGKDKNKTWEPIGGVSICDYQGKGLIGGTSRYEYAQAMVCYYTKK
jgi:predicted small metal-binding protein